MPSRFFPARPLGLCAGLLAGGAALLVSTAAFAADDLIISGSQALAGNKAYNHLTIKAGATVTVPPMGTSSSMGWLNITANTITIEAGAAIRADGAGYAGQNDMPGLCAPMSNGCGGQGLMPGQPGGGGGYFAKGADGTREDVPGTCTDYMAMAPGGAAFFDMTKMTLALGSAGGAAHPFMPAPATAGGSGGGGIRLFAAVVVIDGTVSADGGSRFAASGVGPGGGSGGSIEILSAALSGAGVLSVKGGDGARGKGIVPNVPPNNGGGGSGGVILLHLPMGASKGMLKFLSDGGKNGTDCTGGAMPGAQIDAPLPGPCVDVDMDMHTSVQCGGDDCDDSDATIFPGAPEICDGKDHNCDKQIGEAPNDCTAKAEICVKGACTAPPDAGTGGGSAAPKEIDFKGGCEVPEGLPSEGGAALAMCAAVMALAASRRRRGR